MPLDILRAWTHTGRRVALAGWVLILAVSAVLLPHSAQAAPLAMPQPGPIFTVTTADDTAGPCLVDSCSLRSAIQAANARPNSGGPDSIAFAIPGSGPFSIQPLSELPAVTDPVTINGYAQPGAAANTAADGSNAAIMILLDGSLGGSINGLTFGAGSYGSTLRGLAIGNFTDLYGSSGAGIVVTGGGVVIRGMFLGTDASGAIARPNSYGIRIESGASTSIGGNSPGERNVISGNSSSGIFINNSASNTLIQGNIIGLNAAGTAALGEQPIGVESYGNNTSIGGAVSGASNTISGNAADGIRVQAGSGTQILGNFIGTNLYGNAALPNGQNGVVIAGGSGHRIGGPVLGEANLISGNTANGIALLGGSGTTVQGNYIGTDFDGTGDLGNGQNGILISDSPSNIIGGTSEQTRNIIAGNGQSGVRIQGADGAGNQVLGNYIGTDLSGATALPNDVNGMTISGSSNNTIGGITSGAGNVIAGNTGNGIALDSYAYGNTIQGNLIGVGTNPFGAQALPNSQNGIAIDNAEGTTIGGTSIAARNIISGNGQNGILITNISAPEGAGATIQGNYIGTVANGSAPLPNGGAGISIAASLNIIIGGDAPGTGNLIAGNTQQGVIVGNGSARVSIRRNLMIGNGALGIDLGGDGVTPNDPTDGDAGPNGLQNAPEVVTAAETLNGTVITGTLNSAPLTTYTVDWYASPACDASGFGEGLVYLGSSPATTDAYGVVTFTTSLTITGLANNWITGIATNPAGNSSEFSACGPILTNDLWTNAFLLDLTPTGRPNTTGTTVSQFIARPYQERWYRIAVTPGSRIRLRLDGQPGGVLTLHRNLPTVYEQLSAPINPTEQSAANLPSSFLPSSFLPSSFLPSSFLPSSFLPSSFLPSSFLPSSFLPSSFLPSSFLPSSFLPSSFLPSSFLPSSFLPSSFLPSSFLPSSFLPSSFLPSSFLPSSFLADQYAAAAYRGLMSVAYDPASASLTIDRNTWDLSEELYVRVTGAGEQISDFTLNVTLEGGQCTAIDPVPAELPTIYGTQPAVGARSTLIVWDSARMAASDPSGNMSLLESRLASFAARSDINGTVIDLAALESGQPKYPRVHFANIEADANLTCSTARNVVAEEIQRVINAHRSANPSGSDGTTLQYVVIVGGDDVIPLARYPDVAGLANENEYFPPVLDNSSQNAALRQGRVIGQDIYGSARSIWRGSYFLPIPDLAVGRLVSKASDVIGILDAYIATNGVVTPNSALITGYDFVADAAAEIQNEIRSGLNQQGCAATGAGCIEPRTLITPQDQPKEAGWTADQLRSLLLNTRNDLVFFNGHFDAGNMLAADYNSVLFASEVLSSPIDFNNMVLFGLGCHAGYNIPISAETFGTPIPDWAEAFARRGATYIAATGYAYGDTELTDYGERLMINLTRQLRSGSEPVALGRALVDGKLDYLGQKTSLSGLDEKTLLQFTLYGLPMLQIHMPGEDILPTPEPSIISSAEPVIAEPGASFGLLVGQPAGPLSEHPYEVTVGVNITPTLSTVPLTDVTNSAPLSATYARGSDGEIVSNPAEPVTPLDRFNVDVPNRILRGIGFRSGTYTDLEGIIPLTSSPTTEESRAHLAFVSQGFYPAQNWDTNFFSALQENGPTWMTLMSGQYRSNESHPLSGTLRLFSAMDFRFYYLDENWPNSASIIRNAAIAPAPDIAKVSGRRLSGGDVRFDVDVVNAGSAQIQEVWITWTDPNGPQPRTWQSIDLQRDPSNPTRWSTIVYDTSFPVGTRFMVQAVNGTGLVAANTNTGKYFPLDPVFDPPPPPPAEPTQIQLVLTPASGQFGSSVTFRARLLDSDGDPLPNQQLDLALGTQRASGITDSNGETPFTINLFMLPDTYTGQVSFSGAPGYGPSRATFPFEVTKADTVLTLTPPGPITINPGESAGIVATLLDVNGNPVVDRTVVIIASGTGGTFVRSIKTNGSGVAPLGPTPWPVGTYNIQAYFAGTVPLPNGPSVFSDVFYNPSVSNIVVLQIGSGPPPVTTGTATGPTYPGCPADCFIGAATVTLTVDQPTATTYYQVNGGTWATYTGPFSVTTEGINTVTFYSVSATGVVESPANTLIVKVTKSPITAVLDNFNRANGGIGTLWSGARTGYKITGNRLDVINGGAIYWNGPTRQFGQNQEAFVTLTKIDPNSPHHTLMLKVQQNNWGKGVILVSYDAVAKAAVVEARVGTTWREVARFPVTLTDGAIFGAQALADGTVKVYVNCQLIGIADTRTVAGNFYVGKGGGIGLFVESAPNALLDDFGGGTITP